MNNEKSIKSNRVRHLSRKALEPYINAGRQRPALYAEIAEEMGRLDGKNQGPIYYRQEVAGWLHENEDKRVEPRLGIGLLLIRAAERICNEKGKRFL